LSIILFSFISPYYTGMPISSESLNLLYMANDSNYVTQHYVNSCYLKSSVPCHLGLRHSVMFSPPVGNGVSGYIHHVTLCDHAKMSKTGNVRIT